MNSAGTQLLRTYFDAFEAHDGAAMTACYANNATFKDPVFDLRGNEIGAMWRMLCSRSTDLRVKSSNLNTDAVHGRADWQAWYTFSSSGREVHNLVHSQFRFEHDLIVEQIDTFAFWRWSRQALGAPGLLLGWTPFLQQKVRTNARTALDRYIAAENGAL